jgi:hypothetical protein
MKKVIVLLLMFLVIVTFGEEEFELSNCHSNLDWIRIYS